MHPKGRTPHAHVATTRHRRQLTDLDRKEIRDETRKVSDWPNGWGIADGNLSKLKNGKVSGLRFKTLNAICGAGGRRPLAFVDDEED